MMWTWWQRSELAGMEGRFREVITRQPSDYPMVRAALSLICAEAGDVDRATTRVGRARSHRMGGGGERPVRGRVARVGRGGVLGHRIACFRARGADLRADAPLTAGTAVVIRAPASACVGPADQYLGLLATATGDLALAEVHFEAALRLARRMHSPPFVAAAEVQVAPQDHAGEEERVAQLLRSAEEAAVRMGLHRLAKLAADPG